MQVGPGLWGVTPAFKAATPLEHSCAQLQALARQHLACVVAECGAADVHNTQGRPSARHNVALKVDIQFGPLALSYFLVIHPPSAN